MLIQNFDDFVRELHSTGFSVGGSNNEGIFSLCSRFDDKIRSHTGNPETDPWEWRMRVLEERQDIAYAKVFFSKSGYITRDWYPYFLAVRRKGRSFEDAYFCGTMSNEAKRIYGLVTGEGRLALHLIKRLGGFGSEDKSRFDRALTELQMGLYLTMCGRQSKTADQSGWSSTVFCTTDRFFDGGVFEKAAEMGEKEAEEKITGQILKLNPAADLRKIGKFIRG